MKFLVTGGAGFIGSNFLRIVVNKYPKDKYVCLDALTYASNLKALEPIIKKKNFKFVHLNICDRKGVYKLFKDEHFDYVINFAAESHVDRSIAEPEIFIKTNILGTQVLMDACLKYGIKRFHQISTDEVYGDLSLSKELCFKETSSLNPSSPYSASKASADLLVLAYHRTYQLPITISRSSNNYGPYQYPEKLIPLMVKNALMNKKLSVYGKGYNVRDWLYVDDYCDAIDLIVRRGKDGEIYNVSGHNEHSNLEIIKLILKELHKPESLIQHIKDRPGHDFKYTMDDTKIAKQLKWQPKHNFKIEIKNTIKWYLNNQNWLKGVKFKNYYK